MLHQFSEDVIQPFTTGRSLAVSTAEADPPNCSGHLIESINDGQRLLDRRDGFRRKDVDFSDRQSTNSFEVPALEILSADGVDVVPGIL